MKIKKFLKKLKLNSKITKVPLTIQLETSDCAAVCLDMILKFYKKFIPIEQLRIDCCVSKNGSTAKNLILAAKKYNFFAYGLRMELNHFKNFCKFPCIIHWNYNHFVVLKGYKNHQFFLNDPAKGSYIVDEPTFKLNFTGICLIFKPGKNFKTNSSSKTITKFIFKNLNYLIKPLIFFISIDALMLILNLIKPGYLKFLIDYVLNSNKISWLIIFSLIFILINLVNLTIVWLETISSIKIKNIVKLTTVYKFVWNLINFPFNLILHQSIGDIDFKLSCCENNIYELIMVISPILCDFLTILTSLIILSSYNLILTLAIFMAFCIAIIISNLVAKNSLNLTQIKLKNENLISTNTMLVIKNMELIKLNNVEMEFFQNWVKIHENLTIQIQKQKNLNLQIKSFPNLVANLSIKIATIVGAWLIMNNKFTLGTIFIFNLFLKLITKPIDRFLITFQKLQQIKINLEKIEPILNFKNLQIQNNSNLALKQNMFNQKIGKLTGKIKIKNLTFSYDYSNYPVINYFNLEINPGEKIAIVGPTGYGKSTLIKLLAGLLKPQNGKIYFDNVPIELIDKNIFKQCVATVTQNQMFFHGTIRDNLTMWNKSIGDDMLIDAMKKAQIYNELVNLNGLDLILKEEGSNLSSGQLQRLEIARVLAQQPQILILDEATSSLDLKTEFKIFSQIFKINMTCVVVSQRNQVINMCDRIVNLKKLN